VWIKSSVAQTDHAHAGNSQKYSHKLQVFELNYCTTTWLRSTYTETVLPCLQHSFNATNLELTLLIQENLDLKPKNDTEMSHHYDPVKYGQSVSYVFCKCFSHNDST